MSEIEWAEGMLEWVERAGQNGSEQLQQIIAQKQAQLAILQAIAKALAGRDGVTPAKPKAPGTNGYKPAQEEYWTGSSGKNIGLKTIRTMARFVAANPGVSAYRIASDCHLGKQSVYEVTAEHPWFNLCADGVYLAAGCPEFSSAEKETDHV